MASTTLAPAGPASGDGTTKVRRPRLGVAITAICLLGVAFAGMTTSLFVTLGHSHTDSVLCPGDTFYTIWGVENACGSGIKGWDQEAQATDIMDFSGALAVLTQALILAAGLLTVLKRPAWGAVIAALALAAYLGMIAPFSIGLQQYASHASIGLGSPEVLGLDWSWGIAVLLGTLPVLATATFFTFWAGTPVPPPHRVRGQKPHFAIPPRGIRRREPKPMRILPDFKPDPRPEAPEHELSGDGQVEDHAAWTTRLKSQMPATGKFRF